jgi:hypothetical protein
MRENSMRIHDSVNTKNTNIVFHSSLFSPSNNEVKPTRGGAKLAEWLAEKFSTLGYPAEISPEDWGWCVMCKRNPYNLWVGCRNMHGKKNTWLCFIHAEVPFLKKIFTKFDTEKDIDNLIVQLNTILESEPNIELKPEYIITDG